MPYKYKHENRYETLEDIDKDYKNPYKHSAWLLPGTHNPVRLARENAARERQQFLEELEFRDQMSARCCTLNIDMRNKYEIISAIKMLTAALQELENEVFEVPFDPSGKYSL